MVAQLFEDTRQRTQIHERGEYFSMVSEFSQNLSLYKPEPFILKELAATKTPNAWFGQRYPEQFHQFGSPFLELTDQQTICVSLNTDFFAACLGGRKELGHHTVYFEPE